MDISYENFFVWSGWKIPASLWTPRWCSRLETFGICSLLVEDCGTTEVSMNATNIQHDSAGCGVCSGSPLDARELVRYYYRTPVYSNLNAQKQVPKTFGDGVIHVTVGNVATLKLRVLDTFLNKKERRKMRE